MPKLEVQHLGREHVIRVLPEYLRINYTFQYVMQLDKELTPLQAKRVLDVAKDTFDHTKGINEAHLINLARGVKADLL